MVVCSRCGATVEDGKNDCPYCGVALWQTDTAKESYDKGIGQYHARHDYVSSVGAKDIEDISYHQEIGRMRAQIDARAEAWYKNYQMEQQIKEEDEKKRRKLYEDERKEALRLVREKYIRYIFVCIVLEAIMLWISGGIFVEGIGLSSLYCIFLGILWIVKMKRSHKSDGVIDFVFYIIIVAVIYLWG